MRSLRSGFLSLVTLLLLLLGTACSVFDQTGRGRTVSLATIEVTAASASLAKGTTQALTATGIYSDQTTRDLTGSVTWSSSDVTVATVSNAPGSAGVVTGTGVGTATLAATLGGVTGSAPLTVTAATLVSIGVTPAIPAIAKGTVQPFTATGVFSDSSTQDLTASATWRSGDPAVATISNAAGSQGLATGAGVGAAAIVATFGAVSGGTTLTVTPATLVSIALTPDAPSIAKGTTRQFTATGTFTDASTQDLTDSASWSSSDPTAATVSNAPGTRGLATGTGVNAATITATCGTLSGSTTLTVTPAALVSIGVTPAIPAIAKGTVRQFAATGVFSDSSTQDLTASATWSSGDPAVATISNAAGSKGLATGAGVGAATIVATCGAVSGDTTLTVTPATLVSIALTPHAPSIAKGTTRQFTATGTFTDASTQDLTDSASWTSSDPTAATVSNAPGTRGLATGTGVNAATITAAYGTVSGSTTLTVTAAALVAIEVTPASAAIAKGTTRQFTATGTFTDASTQDLTDSAAWSSGDPAVAAISSAAGSRGLATGTGVGATTITASVGMVSGSTPFSVTAATLVAISVTPALPAIAKGTTLQFTATGTYTDATTQDLTASLTWSSSDTAQAVVSNAAGSRGLATGLLVGTSTIRATNGDLEGSTVATVGPAIVYPDGAPVTVTAVDLLVVPGMTVIVDGSALTGSNTLYWNGAAETDGAFYIKAGTSAANLTGGSGDDTFDFTAPGAVFTSADQVNGNGGSNTLKVGQVSGAGALANVTNIRTLVFSDNGPVSLTTANSLVAAGAALTVDASALTGSNTFVWNGSAETNGTFTITAGASDATITGGSGNDTLTGGTGSNTLNGGPGSDTINLGTHAGTDRINLYNLTSGADTITGFVPLGATHDVIYVSTASGLYFVVSGGGNVSSGAAAVAMVVTASGHLTYDGNVNMIILADAGYPASADVVTALKTGGTDQLTFSHSVGASAELLVVYSDGTDAHLLGINVNPSAATAAGNSSSAMTYTDLATLAGFTPADLTTWNASAFHF